MPYDTIESKTSRPPTLEEWADANGYDRKTRRYRRKPSENAPHAVPGAHGMKNVQDGRRVYNRGR